MLWSNFKLAVGAAYNDGAQSTNREQAAIQACADYVKSLIVREVDDDLLLRKSYYNSYLEAKVRLAGYTITSSFGTVKTGVQSRITVDANRTAIATVIDLWIQQAIDDLNGVASIYNAALIEAVIDLQRFIDNYRNRHTTYYTPTAFDEFGNASVAQLPDGARPYRAVYQTFYPALAESVAYVADEYVQSNNRVYKVVTGGTIGVGQLGSGLTSVDPETAETLAGLTFLYIENPLCFHQLMTSLPWKSREDMSCSHGTPTDAQVADYDAIDFLMLRSTDYCYALEPRGRSFWVWPRVLDYWQVQIEWDGIKTTFADGDDEQFGAAEARAVAFYIKSIVTRSVMDDTQKPNLLMQLYLTERKKLWIQAEEKRTMLL